jgi:uncharacterized protein (DUF488 family)
VSGARPAPREPTLWTIGHSTRTADELIEVLRAHDVEAVADVRRHPGSRRLPQFHGDELARRLDAAGIAYQWIPDLGGRRRPAPDSPNGGWRHVAFRGYADHTASEEFANGLLELLTMAYGLRTAALCAEVLWWRCHRRIIADVVVGLGARVVHLRDAEHAEEHRLRPPAVCRRGVVRWPP